MPPTEADSSSPQWGPTVKLIVGLTIVAFLAALLVRFRNIIGPLLLALILAYVLYPLAAWLSRTTRLSWRTCVNLIYLVLVILLFSAFTVVGLALVQQTQNLVGVVQRFFNDLPALVEDIPSQLYVIGPFSLDLRNVEISALLNEVIRIIQPLLGRAGGLVSSLASRTFATLGWGMFILLISYFTLADAKNVPLENLAGIEIPGYDADFRRLGRHLGRIWNAFLRGQMILFVVTVLSFAALMTVLGVRNALALALLAGLARFVPYVGPFITWTVTGVVTFFMSGNYFGLPQLYYVLLVIGLAVLLDQVFDNLITPRLYGQALGVHPAAVLVAAIVAANLIGFIGLLLAAPVLATLKLIWHYTSRKMLDLDPWEEMGLPSAERLEFPGVPLARRLWPRLRSWWKLRFRQQSEDR